MVPSSSPLLSRIVRRMLAKFAVSGLVLLFAAQAEAGATPERFAPTLDAFVKLQEQDCAALEGGTLEVSRDGIQYVADFNGDGIVDPLVDGRLFNCSSSATLFGGGSGGHYLNVFVSDREQSYRRFEFLARGSIVVSLGGKPILLLDQHGSVCDFIGTNSCFAAYSWGNDGFTAGGGTVAPSIP